MSFNELNSGISGGPMSAKALRGKQIVARCRTLAQPPFSDDAEMLYRPYLGPAHAATIGKLFDWLAEAGMSARIDSMGNVIGRYEGLEPGSPAVLIGSHIDSVRNAGAFDGPLGVMLAIALVAKFNAEQRRFPFALEVIAFGDEEGSRFPTSMMCSRAVTGATDRADMLLEDANGMTVLEALRAVPAVDRGALAPVSALAARRDPSELLCFVEPHIEQGPLLESIDEALGVVTSIAGQQRYKLTFSGQAGHAGTTSMRLRRDALAASAEAIQLIESVASRFGDDVVATVGHLNTIPGAVNVIPGRVDFTLDIRSGDDDQRKHAARLILDGLEEIGRRRDISVQYELLQDLPPTPCDPQLVEIMAGAVRSTGGIGHRMVSGAGHDAMVMAGLVPSIILFIRCLGGISHNPAESVTAEDVDAALTALENFVLAFPYQPES